MEQSPLSHSIRVLKLELKTKLFHRTTRKTWLTQAGVRLLAEAKRILRDFDTVASSIIQQRNEDVRTIRLALGEDLASEPFTRLLFELLNHHPTTDIELRESNHTDAARLVRDRGADVAITLDGRREDRLQRRRGWEEVLTLIIPFGNPFAERQSVSWTVRITGSGGDVLTD